MQPQYVRLTKTNMHEYYIPLLHDGSELATTTHGEGEPWHDSVHYVEGESVWRRDIP